MFLILREWPEQNRRCEKTKTTLRNHSCPVAVSRSLSEALAAHPILKENLHRIVSVLQCRLLDIHRGRGECRKQGLHLPRMTAVMSPHGQREVERKLEIKILPLLASRDDSLFRRKIYKRRQCQGRK